MGEARAQENHQPPAQGNDVFEFRIVTIEVKAQFSAIFEFPVFIEIEHARQLPAAVTLEPVDVPGITHTGSIAGVMALEFEQSQLQRTIQLKPQLFETVETGASRLARSGLLHPEDFVTSNQGPNLTPRATAHRRRAEIPASDRRPAVAAQRSRRLAREKLVEHRPTFFREVIGKPV